MMAVPPPWSGHSWLLGTRWFSAVPFLGERGAYFTAQLFNSVCGIVCERYWFSVLPSRFCCFAQTVWLFFFLPKKWIEILIKPVFLSSKASLVSGELITWELSHHRQLGRPSLWVSPVTDGSRQHVGMMLGCPAGPGCVEAGFLRTCWQGVVLYDGLPFCSCVEDQTWLSS